MKFIIIISYLFLIIIFGCKKTVAEKLSKKILVKENILETIPSKIITDTILYTDGYDFPVGKPDAKKYYNAQKFRKNAHLGDDWNGVGGGNSDFKDPVYAIANGYINFAEDIGGGWGNVIRIIHYNKNNSKVESLYAHCNKILVKTGDKVFKGKQIGTIGTANGAYLAHLHFEIRDFLHMDVGGGYSENTDGYLDPTKYINEHRK